MSSDEKRELQYGRRERASGRIAPLKGAPFPDWWNESQVEWEHVQREVGPWGPVVGGIPRSDEPQNIADTCCGKCPGASCYVDYLTGERE